MISDEGRAQIEASRSRGRRWLEGEPVELVDRTPRRIVLLREAQPGIEVWGFDGGRRDHHAEPLGGIVVAVDHGQRTDADTGEIVDTSRYRCYDPLVSPVRRAFRTLTDVEIDPDKIAIPPPGDLGHAVRRFCAAVCGHDRKNPGGRIDHTEADLVLHAAALVRALMMGP